jgi:hypothetical protein
MGAPRARGSVLLHRGLGGMVLRMTSSARSSPPKRTTPKAEESEFGSGLAICLVKFAEHFENDLAMRIHNVHAMKDHLDDRAYLSRYGRDTQTAVELFNQVERKYSGIEGGISHLIELWANGASDHLYEMKVPQKWKSTALGKKVKQLRDKGLTIGHGFTGKTWTFEDFTELQRLTREIALTLDVGLFAMLGDKQQLDLGQW